MSRPIKNIDEKLSSLLRVRCTSKEKETIALKADQLGLSVSEYIRHVALGRSVKIQEPKYGFELTQQVRKLGVNINQIARHFNSTHVMPEDFKRVLPKLEILLDKLLEDT